MLVAALPILPPDGDKCWAFHVVNDSAEPIDEVTVECVGYEWGDAGNATAVGTRKGPIAPGASLEVHRESDTEVRTSITLMVRAGGRERRIVAELGRLYFPRPERLVPIPILGRKGMLASLEDKSA